MRKFDTCLACIRVGDEEPKELHAIGLCERHYKQWERNRKEKVGDDTTKPQIDDKYARRRALKSHANIAEKFLKFLHFLNSPDVTGLVAAEFIHTIRQLVAVIQIRSARYTTPIELPDDLRLEDDITAKTVLEVQMFLGGEKAGEGTMSPQVSEGDKSPAAVKYRQAKADELSETMVTNRRRSAMMCAIVDRGFNELTAEAAASNDTTKYNDLAAAARVLRLYLGVAA